MIRKENWGIIHYDPNKDEFSAIEENSEEKTLSAPLGAGWLVVAPCNLKCIHCYGNVEDLPSYHPTKEEQLCFAEKIIKSGIMRQILSGGEPLLRKDTLTIIEKLSENEIAVILGTNGSLISHSNIKILKKCTRIELSLDSHIEKINNFIRPSRKIIGNSYQETLKAIKLCQDHEISPRILTCLNKFNYEYIEEMAIFLYEMKIVDWAISWTMSLGRAGLDYNSLMPFSTTNTMPIIEKLRKQYPNMRIRYSDRSREFNKYFFLIFPDGSVGTENTIERKKEFYGSLKDADIAKFWNSNNYNIDQHFDKWIGNRIQPSKQLVLTQESATYVN